MSASEQSDPLIDGGALDPALDSAALDQGGRIGRGIAKMVGAQATAGRGLINVTQLMAVMNKAGAESGAAVEYKRRSADGSEVRAPHVATTLLGRCVLAPSSLLCARLPLPPPACVTLLCV